MKVEQGDGQRGSLKWMQRAADERWPSLEQPILAALPSATCLDWRSPRRSEGWAEYRDAAFLAQVGLSELAPALADFWPARGPQWDALACSDAGHVLLVEAKAHVPEFCTPASSAGPTSAARIATSLGQVAAALGSSAGSLWPTLFYQYANRIAHLWFLRDAGVDAHLVLVGFCGDRDMDGPSSGETWQACYQLADYALGLPRRHGLRPFIHHVHPRVPHE